MAAKKKKKTAGTPSKEQVMAFIRDNPGPVRKREIARQLRLDGPGKMALKKLLRTLKEEGVIITERGRKLAPLDRLPPVAVVEVVGLDAEGDLLARPVSWDHQAPPPRIYLSAGGRFAEKLGAGDRALAKLRGTDEGPYEGKVIRRLSGEQPRRILGVFEGGEQGGRVLPVDRKNANALSVAPEHQGQAVCGDLVVVQTLRGRRRFGLRPAKILENLGHNAGPRSATHIAIHSYDIPVEFPSSALDQAKQAGPVELGRRADLRGTPLVSIDGRDARDFDDAVWAEADDDPSNPEGWHLVVAIADVAHYVRPGDAIDQAARERGNSVYFPDRAIHMLPEALAAGWCSLVPGEDRPCLAVHLWINGDGRLLNHRFERGLMASAARLTYHQVQEARDGHPDAVTRPLMATVINPLYGAYEALLRGREKRGVLELDLAEKRVLLNEDGAVEDVVRQPRFDSHRLIEEFMICANVAAAETLEATKMPCMYRIHDAPSPEKLQGLRDVLTSLGLSMAPGRAILPKHFNGLLKRVADTAHRPMVSELVLRSQAQAEYNLRNIGHFGLALRRYCHFTSPIRRYADLLVHRALIKGCNLGEGGLLSRDEPLQEIAAHISMTERRATRAERDTVDRYLAAFMADKLGADFQARISSVTRFGLFVSLLETGADGLIPLRTLPEDNYICDQKRHLLRGRRTGRLFRLGEIVGVRLVEANGLTGGLIFELNAANRDTGPGERRRKRRR